MRIISTILFVALLSSIAQAGPILTKLQAFRRHEPTQVLQQDAPAVGGFQWINGQWVMIRGRDHSVVRQRGAAGTHSSTGPAAPSSPRVPEPEAKSGKEKK